MVRFFDIKRSMTRTEYLITLVGCLLLCVAAKIINTYAGMAAGILALIWLLISGFRRYNGYEEGTGKWSIVFGVTIMTSMILTLILILYGFSEQGNFLFAVLGFITGAVFLASCAANIYILVAPKAEEKQ